ncbi:MAG: hypothetical protein KME15_17440 [Drouetiella hepatica Uher 2000/2452]|uniref:Outer membrane protein beta-barrel domain-containing protein n=1 Tax=Drouetiella hepatica Uher 2000/2452 TaxID=904376 RepID=A0A951QEI8_9CYAN|nr:hypothetical protein [Drouetiella hepatica Uher 2000/2452]
MNSPRYQKSVSLGLRAIALCGFSLLGGLAAAPSAFAQAAYGSYIGVGGSAGLTSGPNDEGTNAGGVVAVRYRLLEVPLSIRAQALISDRTAIVPTVSYDVPLNWQTDAYIGAGVAFQGGDSDSASPLGNQTAFVVQPGIDYNFPYSNLVLFGNAIIAFDAYKDGGGTAASVQGGLGVRF